MKLTVRTGLLEVTQSSHISLILDASESAEGCRSEMVRLVSGLLAELPGWMTADVHFIGSPTRYDGRLFSRNAPMWLAENHRRASIIAPTIEAIEQGSDGSPAPITPLFRDTPVPKPSHAPSCIGVLAPDAPSPTDQPVSGSVSGQGCPETRGVGGLISAGPMLIIGSGPIFDLEDWPDRDITVVSLGASMLAGCAGYREVFSPSPGDLMSLVHDPVAEARVTGDGFLPMDWDNSALHLQFGDGRFALTGSGGVGHVSLTYVSACEGTPVVTVTRESGKSEVTDLVPIPPGNQPIPRSGVLTEQECATLRSAIARERIDCPLCGGRHAWDTVRCMAVGVILGELIYPSIGDPDPGAIVVLRKSPDGMAFRVSPRGVAVTEDGDAIIHGRSGARLYRFDPNRRVWEEQAGRVEQYYPISEGCYAIFV